MSPHNLFSCFLFPAAQPARVTHFTIGFSPHKSGCDDFAAFFQPVWVVNWVYTVYNHDDALCICVCVWVSIFFLLLDGAKWREVFPFIFPQYGAFLLRGKSWIMGGEWVAWFLGNIIWFHFAPFLCANFIIHTLVFNGIFTPGGKSNFKKLSFWDIALFNPFEEYWMLWNQFYWNTHILL